MVSGVTGNRAEAVEQWTRPVSQSVLVPLGLDQGR